VIHRAVFDTSSLVSAAFRKGSVSERALDVALRAFEVCVSAPGLAHLNEVLARERMARFISNEARLAFFNFIRSRFVVISVSDEDLASVLPSCRDVTDNFVPALSISRKPTQSSAATTTCS
jgi:predicted nucleic acid-binding protein